MFSDCPQFPSLGDYISSAVISLEAQEHNYYSNGAIDISRSDALQLAGL